MMHQKTANQIHKSVAEGEKNAQEIASHCFSRIEALDGELHSLLFTTKDRAMKQAEKVDAKIKSGKPLGKLAGVPVIIKDNIQMKGERTTCASKFLEHYIAPFDATVVELLENEDAIVIGKSNLDEFAMGSSTENSAFGPSFNPWDTDRTPGGSSGGSAAAVAAMFAPLALGSETGGSVRQPASFCGVYGLKPTYGRVSRWGLVAFGSSFDQVSPFARTIEDLALIQDVIAKPCRRDANSLPYAEKASYQDAGKEPIEGKTIGVPFSLIDNLEPEVRKAFDGALEVYKSLGVKVVEITLESMKYALGIYYVLSTAEASTNLARFDGIRYSARSPQAKNLQEVYELSKEEGFGDEVKRRVLLGTYVLSSGYKDAYYRKAQKVRTLMIQDYLKALNMCDVIAMPTTTTPAFKLGAIQDPLKMYQQDLFTTAANLVGMPAMNIPAALIEYEGKKLPIGFQLMGKQLFDAELFQFAYHFSKAAPFSENRPPQFDKEVP